MRFDQFTALVCKNCSKPIPLPPAIRPDSQGFGSWPMGASSRNFLCPECRHVYRYAAEDVKLLPFSEMDSRPAKTQRNLVCIELPCGSEQCPSEVRVNTLMPFDANIAAMAPAMLVLAQVYEIQCGRGHLMSTLPEHGTALDAYFDEDWELGDRGAV